MKRPKNIRLRTDAALSPNLESGDCDYINYHETKDRPTLEIEDDTQEPFERMNVQVTVYALSGISRNRKHGKDKKKKPKSTSSSVSASGFPFVRSRSTLSTSRSTTGESPLSTFESATIPTTAVVSVHREKMSSGFAIETFLPSMRLKCKSSADGETQQCSAFWAEDDSFALLGADSHVEPSTFEINRTMQREIYRPDTKVGMLSSFVHERIDLYVSVGKGREIIPLGIASIAITGDEEGEIISNIPVKRASPEEVVIRKHSLKHQKKKKYRPCFSDEPNLIYSLEENATLRVGVRVIPTKILEQTDRYLFKPKRSALDTIIDDSPDDSHLFIELNDENSLIENLIVNSNRSGRSNNVQNEPLRGNSNILFTKTPEFGMGGFFCSATDSMRHLCHQVCDNETFSDADQRKMVTTRGVRNIRSPRNKKTSARIQTLSIMSDMSDSTIYTDYDSVFTGIFQPQQQERAEL